MAAATGNDVVDGGDGGRRPLAYSTQETTYFNHHNTFN
jgi:hypothetical protein